VQRIPVPRPLPALDAETVYGELLRPATGPEHARGLAVLLLTAGIKIGEAIALNVGDVDVPRARVVVDYRGPNQRELPLEPLVAELLRGLLAPARFTPLFRHPPESRLRGQRLDPRTARKLVQDVAGCTPHTLTNTLRVRLVERGQMSAFHQHSGLTRTAYVRYAAAGRRAADRPA